MTRLSLLLAYERARLAGFHHFAEALAELIRRDQTTPATK